MKNLSNRTMLALIVRAKTGDQSAISQIIADVNGAIHQVSRRYHKYFGRCYDYEDVVQAATMGVLDAITRFDVGKNAKFLTYAIFWIRHHIQKLWSEADVVRRPRTHKYFRSASIDAPLWDDGQPMVIPADADVVENVSRNETIAGVRHLLKNIDPRSSEILISLYSGRTLEDIGDEYNISRERARQLSNQALLKLKKIADELGMVDDALRCSAPKICPFCGSDDTCRDDNEQHKYACLECRKTFVPNSAVVKREWTDSDENVCGKCGSPRVRPCMTDKNGKTRYRCSNCNATTLMSRDLVKKGEAVRYEDVEPLIRNGNSNEYIIGVLRIRYDKAIAFRKQYVELNGEDAIPKCGCGRPKNHERMCQERWDAVTSKKRQTFAMETPSLRLSDICRRKSKISGRQISDRIDANNVSERASKILLAVQNAFRNLR